MIVSRSVSIVINKIILVSTLLSIFIFGVVMILLSYQSIINKLQLNNDKKETTAKIISWRTDIQRGIRSHQVQYEFLLENKLYTCTDETSRKNLWSSVSHSDWERSKKPKTLPVIYSQSDPWINRLKYSKSSNIYDAICAFIIGIFMLLLSSFYTYIYFSKKSKKEKRTP